MIHLTSHYAPGQKPGAFFALLAKFEQIIRFFRTRMLTMTRKGVPSRDARARARGYHPCSFVFVVLALVAGSLSLVGGATVNRQSTNTASAVANANKGRGVMVPQFENAGREAGLQIWRIEVSSLNLPQILSIRK